MRRARRHAEGSSAPGVSAPAQDHVPFAATSLGESYGSIETLPVSVLLDSVRSLYNVGALFRTAEAVRVERLYLSGITAVPPHKGISKTALGAETIVEWERVEHPLPALDALRARGYEVAAVETSLRAVDVFDWQPTFPVCVLLGHEVDGLSAQLLDRADTHVRLPMLGRKQSLNVATAGGIVIYELLRKFRCLLRDGRVTRR